MLAGRKLRRRIDDALATASPVAFAEAMDAHICRRATADLRELVARTRERMDAAERAQLELYLRTNEEDDLIGHRFSAFLRQNPRALAALDAEAIDAILAELGELPRVQHPLRRLSPSAAALVAVLLLVTTLPLAAQYLHQRGLLQGLTDPIMPAQIVPFVQQLHPAAVADATEHRSAQPAQRAPVNHAKAIPQRHATYVRHRAHTPRRSVLRSTYIAWKFDRRNNPYFNRSRWHHPFVADSSQFGNRARLKVRAYLHALVAGNFDAALAHLGMPPNTNTNALSELPIVTRSTNVAILGSKLQRGGTEQVQADIVTGGREYYEIFDVAHDGPALRIVDRYYIPVNRSAEVAARLLDQSQH